MAKKTTPKPGASRRKKASEKVEEAEIVDASEERPTDPAPTSEAASDVSNVPEATIEDERVTEPDSADAVETSADGEDTPPNADAAEEVSEENPEDERPAQREPVAGQESRSSPLPLMIGGVVAGAIGFFAAYATGVVNQGDVPAPVDLSQIENSIAEQSDRIEAVAAQIPEAQAAPDVSALETSLAGVADDLAGLQATLGDLEARLAALESAAPSDTGSAAVDPALLDDVAALQAALKEQEAEIAAMQAETEAAKDSARSAAADTLKRAAMTRIHTALETGAPFGDAMSELEQLGVDVPSDLQSFATSGLVTLASLQETFPEAARSALAADRAEAAKDGHSGGFADFLRDQLGARSLTPQEGDSTDAVLSRAEAALLEGRMSDVLAELQALPDVAKPALSQWQSTAQQRADAIAAAQSLSDSLN